MTSKDAVNKLAEYLLGKDYYIVDPIHSEQANDVIVDDILKKYSRRYRKELRLIYKLKRLQEKGK